jgi:hypothetical protein
MKQFFSGAFAIALLFSIAAADAQSGSAAPPAKSASQAKADDPHRKQDIDKHRQMARAHGEAAECLERGEKESVCHERLRSACQGIAVGRYCGMRHSH